MQHDSLEEFLDSFSNTQQPPTLSFANTTGMSSGKIMEENQEKKRAEA